MSCDCVNKKCHALSTESRNYFPYSTLYCSVRHRIPSSSCAFSGLSTFLSNYGTFIPVRLPLFRCRSLGLLPALCHLLCRFWHFHQPACYRPVLCVPISRSSVLVFFVLTVYSMRCVCLLQFMPYSCLISVPAEMLGSLRRTLCICPVYPRCLLGMWVPLVLLLVLPEILRLPLLDLCSEFVVQCPYLSL